MRRIFLLSGIFAAASLAAQVGKAPNTPVFTGPPEKREKSEFRQLHGEILDVSDRPLEKSVVYLKNLRTLRIITFITNKDGVYHFGGLAPNVDYEVRAENLGAFSATRTLSSLDGRKDVALNLRVEKKKGDAAKPDDVKKPDDTKKPEPKKPSV